MARSTQMLGLLVFVVFAGVVGSPRRAEAQSQKPVVLVLDVGRVRLRGERVQRALAQRLERDVLRVTDDRAAEAAGTLTIAHDSGRSWMLRYQSQGRVETAEARVARAGALIVVLTELAANLVDRIDGRGRDGSRPASTSPEEDEFYTVWADEILDPYAGLPVRAVVTPVVVADLLDPFTVTTAGRVRFTEVLDPWSRR